MSVPNREEALSILRESGLPEHVIDHCLSVAEVAKRLARTLKIKGEDIDIELVEAGALLHDIGRSETHSVHHGAVGGRMARACGLSEKVARVIERHVGAGIPEDEARVLSLPEGSYIPETLEEKVVCYADKLIEGGREVDIQVTVEHFAEELGENHQAVVRLKNLHHEMAELLEGNDFT